MKKTIRFFGIALVLLMLLPMLAALPVRVSATEPEPSYDAAEDGELLRAVNFKADGWQQGFYDKNNKDADVVVSDDGSSVKLTVQNAGNKRAMWGGFYSGAEDDSPEDIAYDNALGNVLPMKAGAKYTMVFDLTLGSNNVAFGIHVDGNNTVLIRGNGQSQWYQWNTSRVGETADDNEKWNFHTATGASTRDTNTYAVTVDYDAKTMELWVKDVSDGAFYFVRSMTYTGSGVWDSNYFRCRLYVRYMTGTPNSSYSADVANLKIYKGNALKQLTGNAYQLGYWSRSDGDELLDVNFGDDTYMTPALSANNNYDDLDVTVDGGSVTFTSLGTDSRRGLWGDDLPAGFFPLSAGTKYSVFFDLTMDAGMKCAFYPDGAQGIAIIQNSTYTKYQSWSSMSGTEANWANKTDYGKNLTGFAVELDYDTGSLTLYGRNRNGLYVYINRATGLTFDGDALGLYFWAGNAEGGSVTVSDVRIEKGLTVPVFDANECGFTAYQAAADNSLLRVVNFKEDGYNPDFADKNNLGADVEISNDGTAVSFRVHSNHNKRAMWGDYLVDTLPLYSGGYNSDDCVKYTFVYDVTFGNENVGVGLQVDGTTALVVDGAGGSHWFRWNTKYHSSGANTNWLNFTDVPADEKQTFAVTMDYNAHTFELYVKRSNGSFAYVRSITRSDEDWSGSRVRARFNVRAITGTPDDTYTAVVANLKIYKGLDFGERNVLKTAAGAAVRLNTPTGLRFTGYIGKALLDGLKAEFGDANVRIGMLITPTDYLTDNSLAFTKEALDGCGALPAGKKYRKINAATVLESENGHAYKINCVLSDVLEENYGRNFSAITYIEVNGSTYYYSGYTEADNARSIAYVAEAALLDISDAETGEYPYAIGSTGKYSPYTAAQQSALAGFRSAESFTIMSYNIEMFDGDDDWEGRNPDKAIETILTYSPDILGLQEVNQVVKKNWLGITTKNDGWNDHLTTLTSNGYSRVQGNTSRDCWCDLYYKTAKFNKLNSDCELYTSLVSEYPGVDAGDADMGRDNLGRMFTWARLEDKATGKIVLAICTHLHYREDKSDTASTDENAAVRQYEVRLLIAWINSQSFSYDGVVIVGDMNAHYLEAQGGRGRRVIDEYRSEGYLVARDSAAIKGDTGGTLAETNRTTRPQWIYDYVLTKGNVSALSFTVVDNKIDNGYTSYPSDHLPLRATIVFD